MVTDLTFGVLGSLEVIRHGRELAIPPGRPQTVLACLITRAGSPVSADALIAAAWPETLPAWPRAALYTVVSRLRAVLGADALTSDTAGYTLTVGSESVDAHRFESLLDRARSAPTRETVALLERALALWRGPAYSGLADRDFANIEAQRLDRERLDATEDHAEAVLACGSHARAAAELEALLGEDPFREHAVELLMTALYRAGRKTEALARYRTHRTVMAEELGLDPAPALRDLESSICGNAVPPGPGARAVAAPPAWLDTSTAFFGRQATLCELVAAVADNRLVTVTGMGGVGKSRLVAQALPALSDRLAVPITIVRLVQVGPGRVGYAIADALGLHLRERSITDEVLEYLSIAQVLLVIDNCEHVLAEVTRFCEAVLRDCPRVRIVTTSRHRLGYASERVVPLAPFPIGARDCASPDLARNPAIRLFSDRVARLRPTSTLVPDDIERVAEVCRRLDGLPLALELAASRAASLGVDQVLCVLAQDPGTEPVRDLRDVVDWSARLLTADQRRLLRLLAVFAADFSADDVVDMASHLGPWTDRRTLIDALEEIVESHLVEARPRDAHARYHLLALVRSFAGEELAASGDDAAARLAHAQWVRAVVGSAARAWVSGNAAAAGRRLVRMGPDVNKALRWALTGGRLDIAASITGSTKLCLHWLAGSELGDLVLDVAERCADAGTDPALAVGLAAGAMTSAERGQIEHTRLLARLALDRAEADPPRMLADLALAVATFYSGQHDQSATSLQHIIDLRHLSPGYRVEPYTTLSLLACARGDFAAARSSSEIALTGAESAQNEPARAFALYTAGEIDVRVDPNHAAAHFREATTEAERIGAAHVSQVARLALFALLTRQQQYPAALAIIDPLLEDLRSTGAWPQIWTAIRITAELLAAHERGADAAYLLAAADAAPTAPPPIGDDIGRYSHLKSELTGQLGTTATARISDLAARNPRSRTVSRARTLLARLA